MSAAVPILVKRLAHNSDLPLPAYESAGAAGADIRAAIDAPMEIAPGERRLVPTGLVFQIADGFEVQLRPRSGLAARHGLTVLNTPGTIDSDYRGEISVILINLGVDAVTISRGDRIAQIVVAPVSRGTFEDASELDVTSRGSGGFGSTGL